MRSVAPITKIVPLFLWSAKMPKNYAKCQKFMLKLWNFIFCHLNIVRAVYKLSFKLLVRSVAQITKIVPPFLWFRGGLCYKHRRIRHGVRRKVNSKLMKQMKQKIIPMKRNQISPRNPQYPQLSALFLAMSHYNADCLRIVQRH